MLSKFADRRLASCLIYKGQRPSSLRAGRDGWLFRGNIAEMARFFFRLLSPWIPKGLGIESQTARHTCSGPAFPGPAMGGDGGGACLVEKPRARNLRPKPRKAGITLRWPRSASLLPRRLRPDRLFAATYHNKRSTWALPKDPDLSLLEFNVQGGVLIQAGRPLRGGRRPSRPHGRRGLSLILPRNYLAKPAGARCAPVETTLSRAVDRPSPP